MTEKGESTLIDITAGWMLSHIFDFDVRGWLGYLISGRLTLWQGGLGDVDEVRLRTLP